MQSQCNIVINLQRVHGDEYNREFSSIRVFAIQ